MKSMAVTYVHDVVHENSANEKKMNKERRY